MRRPLRIAFLSFCVLSCLPADAQQQEGVRVVWRDRPSIRVGNTVRVDFRAKLQFDGREFSPYVRTDEGHFDLHRVRFAIEGNILNDLEYQVEREFRSTFGGGRSPYPWRDVYVNFRRFDDFQVQAGKFKIPFSREQLTGSTNLDFVNRSRIADELAPGRDIGVVMHGRFFQRGIGYEVGVFRNDGENSESSEAIRGNRTFALRVTGTPLRPVRAPRHVRDIVFGAAWATSDVPEGLNGLRGRMNSGEVFFSRVHMKGRRQRYNAEAAWTHGPFGASAEFIHVNEVRKEQSVRQEDLPAKISRGWYISGTWVVTGESKDGGVNPRREFLSGGIGAIELAGRYEQIRFGSNRHDGLPFSSPRAPHILGNRDRAVTIGVNWYLNRYARVQANSILETLEHDGQGPIAGRNRFWMGILQLQLSM